MKKKLPGTDLFDIRMTSDGCPYGLEVRCRDCQNFGGTKDFGYKLVVFCNYKQNVEKQRRADELRRIQLALQFK